MTFLVILFIIGHMVFNSNNHIRPSILKGFLPLGKFQHSTAQHSTNLYIIALVIIFTFSVGVRIYWASKQDRLYHDEYASIFFSNGFERHWPVEIFPYSEQLNYNQIYTGKGIKLKYFYADNSLKDCISDIVSLYKNSKDPFISNLYYSFLRISFIGRVVYKVQDIIMTGTILNCIFFAISFIFMYKLLNLIFVGNRVLILFGILCISLLSSSISFAMFLRPYQIQETFFIVFTYFVFYILSNKNYSIKNFIILTLCTGFGYLTLTSSILFVLCTSLSIFLYAVRVDKKEEINDRLKSKSEYIKSFFTYIIKRCYIHIFIIIVSIFILFFTVIIPLGLTTRYGNLEIESINKDNNLKVITTKIKYKSKVFRDSDIYQVYDVKTISNYDTNEILEFRTTDIARVVLTTLYNFNEENIKNIEVSYLLKPKMKKISQIILLSLLIPVLIIFLKNNLQNIKNNKKSLLYFALSFVLSFLVAQIFYASFFSNFINQNNRGANSLKFPFDFFNYLNSYAFAGFMIPIFIFLLSPLIIKIDNKNFNIKKYLIPVLIIFQALLWSITSDILSPFKLERYSIGSYPLILIILPLSVAMLLDNKKLRYIFIIIVSGLYIQNAFTSKNLAYVEINTSNKDTFIYKQKPDITVYGVNNFLSIFHLVYLDDTQEYVLVKDYENLIEKIKIDNQDNFYVIFGNEDDHTKNQVNIENYKIVTHSSIDSYGKYSIVEFARDR